MKPFPLGGLVHQSRVPHLGTQTLGMGWAEASGNLFQNPPFMGSPFSNKGNMARTQGGGICLRALKSVHKADE